MANVVAIDSDSKPDEKTPGGWYRFWMKEKTAAQKRLDTYQTRGNRIVDRYVDERVGNDFYEQGGVKKLNLFHTNVSTMQSMLLGQTPRADVSREHQDPDDDIARVASTLLQRMLQSDDKNLSTILNAALLDRLLPGMGICRVRYDFTSSRTSVIDPQTMEMVESEQIDSESAPTEYVHWQDFLWGWGRTWAEIPWIGFRAYLTKDEATIRFSAEIAKNLEYKNQLPSGDPNDSSTTETEQKNNIQKAEVWEFWDKKRKKVFWFSEGTEIILDVQDDPLELENFWPVPRPMTANMTTTLYLPTADFLLAQDLYNQIDELWTRVTVITRAVKVVGVYDQSSSDAVGRMLKEGVENDLIPVDNWAMFGEKGGLQGTIDWFPVQEVVATLQTLRQILGETIELLYQVTGMSDVLRGANTDQYTSDGTNQLKAKFGSIRIQALQDEFARFASELEGLKGEIIAKHFNERTILKQSNAQFMPEADRDKIMPAVQLLKAPDVKWRIDIRPESIAMIDYAQLKSERTEYLTAMATFLQSANSMVAAVPQSMPILLEFMKFGMAGFKGSDYMEGMLDQAIDMAKKQPPQDKEGKKGEQEQQKEQMKHQMEMQKIQAKAQADMQTFQAKTQGELQKIQMDNQANMQEQQSKANSDLQKIAADLQADLRVIAAKLDADITTEQAQAEFDNISSKAEHQYDMLQEDAQHDNTMDEIEEQNEYQENNDGD